MGIQPDPIPGFNRGDSSAQPTLAAECEPEPQQPTPIVAIALAVVLVALVLAVAGGFLGVTRWLTLHLAVAS